MTHFFTIRLALVTSVVLVAAQPALAQHLLHGASGLPHGIPDLCAGPTIQSVTGGAWSNPGTWSGSRVPTTGDRVLVSAGTAVSYDRFGDDRLICVSIAGSLTFRTDANTRLKVGTMIVHESGALEIGREAQPIAPGLTAELVIADEPLNLGLDPEQFGTGLIGLGRITMHGAARYPTFSRMTQEPGAGEVVLRVADTVSGWAPADQLIVPDSRQLGWSEFTAALPFAASRTEQIGLASASGGQLALASGLQFDHPGARNGDGVLEFLPHVANITRNVIIRSENPAGTRGHVIFVHRADVDIRYVLFQDLGRTTIDPLDNTTFDTGGGVTHVGSNQIGRYPIHLHHVSGLSNSGRPYQYWLIGNAIVGSPKWGITIHNTHYGLVQGNVMYHISGAGFMAEDGSESFNVVERNIAILLRGTGGRQAGGREATGFYFRGPNNYVRDNVASNLLSDTPDSSYGYKYFQEFLGDVRIPRFPGADTLADSEVFVRDSHAMPVLEFARNEVYGATESGMTWWWVGSFGSVPRAGSQPNVLRDLRVWHVYNKGIFNYPSGRIRLDGFVMRAAATLSASGYTTGFEGGDYLAEDLIITNADIQGAVYGIIPSQESGDNPQVIQDSYLRNFNNLYVRNLGTASYRADLLLPRRVTMANVLMARPASAVLPYREIALNYMSNPVHNLVGRDELVVYNHNRVTGLNFQVYFDEQDPNYVVPQTVPNSDGTPSVLGSPVAGLTNAQNWVTYNVAIRGAVAPCSVRRADMDGFTCDVNETFVPPGGTPPRAPRNPRIVHGPFDPDTIRDHAAIFDPDHPGRLGGRLAARLARVWAPETTE